MRDLKIYLKMISLLEIFKERQTAGSFVAPFILVKDLR